MRSARSTWARSTADLVLARQPGRQDQHIPGGTGLVTNERAARLCGDHSEHAYDVLRLTTHGSACTSVCYHPETPGILVCSTALNSIAQYDIARSACISHQTKGHKRCSNAYNPCLSHVAVYGDPVVPAIELQLTHCGKFTWLEGHTAEVRCCSISCDGSLVVSGGRNGQAFLWVVQQPEGPSSDPVVKHFRLEGHAVASQVKTCCIAANGMWAATASTDGQVLLWDLSSISRSDAAVCSPESSAIEHSHESSTAGISDQSRVQPAATFTLPRDKAGDYATALDLGSDSNWLAIGSRTGKVYLAGVQRQQLQQLPLRHQDGSKVRCCAISPDASKLATTADDGRMVLWDISSSSWVLSIHEHFKPAHGCCWSPDGRKIVTAGMDALICIMDVVLLVNQHKLRIPLRLDTGRPAAAPNSLSGVQGTATAAELQDIPAAGSVSMSRANTAHTVGRQQHPLLRKAAVTEAGKKLLSCVPVLQQNRRLRSHQSQISAASAASSEMQEAVLCADQAGKIFVQPLGKQTAAATDLAIGSSVYCCSFDGTVVAAAKRDGAITALNCSTALLEASSNQDDVVTLEAQSNAPVAVSAKLNMLVNGVSINSQLGRVALVGTEKKVHQTGVLWLWEYDPSVRPAGSCDDSEADDIQGFNGFDALIDRLGSRGSGMLSSGESRIPSIGSPRGMSDSGTLQDSNDFKHAGLLGDVGGDSSLNAHRNRYGSGSPAAAAIGPYGWLWKCENPVKVLTVSDTPLQCCAFAKGTCAKLVVGTSAGWLAVVNLAGEEMEETWTRYQIHTCEVTAVDFASDGATIVSGSTDGRVIMWSHVTGFKLAVWTMHSAAIRTLAFNTDATLLAVGDAAGTVSSWDVLQSCLVTAAQAHDGPVTAVNWLNSAGSENTNTLVSCGYDGAVATLQIDPGIYKLYRAAFWGLYHSCKRSHKIHKLETAISWHLAQGALQDASVLQLLVNTAAADGNVAVLSMLLPLFERMGWLLHLGPVIAGPPPASLKKIDSDKSMGLARKSFFQPAAAAPVPTPLAAGDISEYAIHPHDRIPDTTNSSRGHSRRNTREAPKDGHVGRHTRQDSFAFGSSVGALVDGGTRSSRWTHSVADIGRLMAFQGQHQRAQQLQQQQAGLPSSPRAALAATAAILSAPGSLPASNSVKQHSSDRSAGGVGRNQEVTGVNLIADTTCSEPDSPRAFDSSDNGTSPNTTPHHSPTRLLSPINSRNARTPAALPSLDTLHEEHHVDASTNGMANLDVDEAFSVRTRSADALPVDDASNALATPPGGSIATADDDGTEAQSSTTALCPGIAHVTGPSSGGGSLAGGNSTPMQRQGSSSSLASQGGNVSLVTQPTAAVSVQQQQQLHKPSMGRQLLSFLSGKRMTASAGGIGDAADSDAGDVVGIHPNLRQRSLSEGAALGQRLNAVRSLNLHGRDLGSSSSPGSAGLSPLAREQTSALTAASKAYAGPGSAFASVITAAAAANAAAAAKRLPGEDNVWDSTTGLPNPLYEEPAPLSPTPSRRRSLQSLLTRFMSSKRTRQASGKSLVGPLDAEADAGKNLAAAPSGFSALSGGSNVGERPLGSSGRRLAQLFSWRNWRRSSKSYQVPDSSSFIPQPQQPAPAKVSKDRAQKVDLLQIAMASQQAQCVRLVVDALLAGRFSKMSVVLHMYDALQALIHDAQHKRACRRLLKHLPMIDNGEVEVDSLLTYNTNILYKCSANGHPGNIWASATSGQQPLLDALDVLMKRASWRDSIAALLMWPVLWSLKHLGAAWLWLWARQGLKFRNRVQVSATSKLVPVARAAEIRAGSKGNLLRQLVSANVDADLYGKELVRAIINVKWDSFARAFLLMQGVQFVAFVVLFLAYLFVAVYGCDPEWSIAELLSSSQGQAAVVLECILMFMMFGQAADEAKQIATYGREYFNSPWNYMDVASCVIIGILFLLHIGRLNHQLFVILMALEVLLLCLRSLYFCMALDQIGALLRMVLIVIKDMRYFFMMLVFLLISFGLTFSVLMSPVSKARLNIISAVASNEITDNTAEVQVFGSLEDSMTQLFTIMFGDVQFTTLKTIMNVNTVASRLAVVLACVYAVLVLIVLVNLLIAIVDETYGTVKESEADQMLRNKALIIDEIESTLTDAVIKDLNGRVLLPYVHILIPQAARADQHHRRRDLHAKFRKLKTFLKQRLQEQALSGTLSVDTGPSPRMSTTSALMAPSAGNNWPLQLQRRVSAGASQQTQQSSAPAANSRIDGAEALAAVAVGKLQEEVSQLSTSVLAFDRQLEAVSSSNAAAVAELTSKVEAMQSDINQVKDLLLALVARQQN